MNRIRTTAPVSFAGRYMLAEHQHISYLFDKAYDDIYRYIFRIIRSAELIRKFTGSRIYTGYYYDSTEFCCKRESTFVAADGKYPIYLYMNPDVSTKTYLATEENTGQHAIILHVFLHNITALRFQYHSKKDNTAVYDADECDNRFREDIIGFISHEFVHVRQMFCGVRHDRHTGANVHIDGNPIARQSDNKDRFTRAVEEIPHITDECRDMIWQCFYLFTRTEMDARISASLRHLDSEEKMEKLKEDYIREREARNDDGAAPERPDPFDYAMLDFCINRTLVFNDIDDMEMCLDYMRRHRYAYTLLKEIDRKENLNFFRFGLEYTMRQYKARLYKGFYKLLKKYGYESRDGILEAFVCSYKDEDGIFMRMTREPGSYIVDEICC